MKPVALLIPVLALAACWRAPTTQEEAGGVAAHTPTEAPLAPTPAAAPGPAPQPPAPAPGLGVEPGSPARTDGYGGLRFGVDAAQARAAWQGELKGDAIEPDNCGYLTPKADAGFRIGFMFEQGQFVRYDVDVADVAAPGGGRVGQSRADIERLYPGRIQVQPHEYVPGGNYLRVTDAAIVDGALVFETDEAGKVTRWRVGRAPQVDYVEGCA